jgi:hypothetical protein
MFFLFVPNTSSHFSTFIETRISSLSWHMCHNLKYTSKHGRVRSTLPCQSLCGYAHTWDCESTWRSCSPQLLKSYVLLLLLGAQRHCIYLPNLCPDNLICMLTLRFLLNIQWRGSAGHGGRCRLLGYHAHLRVITKWMGQLWFEYGSLFPKLMLKFDS